MVERIEDNKYSIIKKKQGVISTMSLSTTPLIRTNTMESCDGSDQLHGDCNSTETDESINTINHNRKNNDTSNQKIMYRRKNQLSLEQEGGNNTPSHDVDVFISSLTLCVGDFIPLTDTTVSTLQSIEEEIQGKGTAIRDEKKRRQQQLKTRRVFRRYSSWTNSSTGSSDDQQQPQQQQEASAIDDSCSDPQRKVTKSSSFVYGSNSSTGKTWRRLSSKILRRSSSIGHGSEGSSVHDNNDIETRDNKNVFNINTNHRERIAANDSDGGEMIQSSSFCDSMPVDGKQTSTQRHLATVDGSTKCNVVVPMEKEPDVYGQIHPIENDDVVEQCLQVFEKRWRLRPADVTKDALLAETNCPDIVSVATPAGKAFKLLFLRTDAYRIDDAISRYLLYWSKRILVFGPDHAFRPLTMKSLTDGERYIIESEYISIIPSIRQIQPDLVNVPPGTASRIEDRVIVYLKLCNFEPGSFGKDDFVRALWKFAHLLTMCNESQKRGLVVVANALGSSRSTTAPMSFYKYVLPHFKQCLPFRVSGYHVFYPSTIVRVLYPIFNQVIIKLRLKIRVFIHTTIHTDNEIIELLQGKYGILKQQLPTDISGDYKINNKEFLQQLIREGK